MTGLIGSGLASPDSAVFLRVFRAGLRWLIPHTTSAGEVLWNWSTPRLHNTIPDIMNFRNSFCSLLLFASPGVAFAQQTCDSDSIPLQTTNWSSSVSVAKFDSSLGVLQSIDFKLTGRIVGSASIESLDAAPSTVTTDYKGEITLTRPDMTTLVVSIPDQQFIDNLTAYDGTIDFAGTSGIAHTGISAQDVQIINVTAAADLALFTGVGNIVLPVTAAGTSNASGSGNLITQFLTDAESSVNVCYNYAMDCNGNGIDDAVDVGMGTSNDLGGDGIPDECQPKIRRFCEGDGAANDGVDCPCTNGGIGEGCDNGLGFGGKLKATGNPSISNDTLVLTSTQIPMHSPGYFFGSTQATPMGTQNVIGSGLTCLLAPVRIQKIAMGGGSIPLAGAPSISVFMGLTAGETSYFQYWYRNNSGTCISDANATNGVIVTWGL